jgi:hypothetical protein
LLARKPLSLAHAGPRCHRIQMVPSALHTGGGFSWCQGGRRVCEPGPAATEGGHPPRAEAGQDPGGGQGRVWPAGCRLRRGVSCAALLLIVAEDLGSEC